MTMKELERWIVGERLSFASKALMLLGQTPPQALLNIDRWLEHELPLWRRDERGVLPRACRAALRNFEPGDLAKAGFKCAGPWRELKHQSESEDELHFQTESGASLFAQQLISGSGSARSLTLLCRALLGKSILRGSTFISLHEMLQKTVPEVRSAAIGTFAKIEAVEHLLQHLSELGDAAGADRARMRLLLDHLADRVFVRLHAWPLLILGENTPISLPVGIDVEWPQSPSQRLVPFRVDPVKTEWIDVSAFAPSFRAAALAAKGLWRSKHGNAGDFRDLVRRCGFRIDLTIAEEICRGLLGVKLEQRSAEIYFSQIMLSRLLGKPGAHATAITGAIGKQRVVTDRETGAATKLLDFEIIASDHEAAMHKLRDTVELGRHDRFIVPNLPKEDLSSLSRKGTDVIVGCQYLQHIADCAQPEGWRHHRFIHCPDLAQTSLAAASNAAPEPESLRMVERLRGNKQSVLFVDDVDGSTVVRALRFVNHIQRPKLAKKGFFPPPMASYVFVRCVEDQVYDSFWMVIWSAIGGSDNSLMEFLAAPSLPAAAGVLQRELNRMQMTPERPDRRAPDVLVMVDTYRFLGSAQGPAFSGMLQKRDPFAVLAMVELESSHLHTLLGSTRVIVVQGNASSTEPTIVRLSEQASPYLLRLSPFRWGFNVPMAARVLCRAFPEIDLHLVLTELTERGWIRTTVGGFFYLPEPVRQALDRSIPKHDLIDFNRSCALAYAPFLERRGQGLAMDNALLPWNVLEARYHFMSCWQALKAAGMTETEEAREARNNLNFLIRFALPDCWWKVRACLSGGDNELAAELAEELFSANPGGAALQPELLLDMAVVLSKASRGGTNADHERANEFFASALELAQERFRNDRTSEQARALMLNIASRWRVFLWMKVSTRRLDRESWGAEAIATIGHLDILIQEQLDGGCNGRTVQGAWFEQRGDAKDDPLEAARIYLSGLRHVRDFAQLWCKAAGSLRIAFERGRETRLEWREFGNLLKQRRREDGGEAYLEQMLQWSRQNVIRRRCNRVQTGITAIERLLKPS